jgi:hypothetical protein
MDTNSEGWGDGVYVCIRLHVLKLVGFPVLGCLFCWLPSCWLTPLKTRFICDTLQYFAPATNVTRAIGNMTAYSLFVLVPQNEIA